MAYNGSGVFSRIYSWITDRNNGVKIDATRFDTEMDGMAVGLSTAICRDGQSTITADIPFNSQKITGLGDATADTDGLNRRTGDGRFVRQIGGGLGPALSVAASTVNLSLGRSFYKTATTGLTWVFSNPASIGNQDGFILELTNGGIGTQTWPAEVAWPNGVDPSLTTSGTDILVFITRDGGLTWRGSLSQRNSG